MYDIPSDGEHWLYKMVWKKLKVCPYETVVTLEFTISKENPLQILSPKTQVSNTLHLEPVQKKDGCFQDA
jgi:hypothetical protein